MKILFSPSETKFKGGETKKINKNSFIFPELFEERIKVINLYQTFIDRASNEELEKLFGTKKSVLLSQNGFFTIYFKLRILALSLSKCRTSNLDLQVNYFAISISNGFHYCFTHCWMRMN